MPLWYNKLNLYTFGWCLYYLQGTLYPMGSIIPRFVLTVLLIVSLYYFFYANFHYKLPTYFLGLNLLMILFLAYGVFFMITSKTVFYGVPSFYYLKLIWISLLPIYSFYVLFKETQIDEKNVYVWILIFFIVTTVSFFSEYRLRLNNALLNRSASTEFTNNTGYLFLGLLPICVFLYKKLIIQYLAVGFCFAFMLMAMKRGAVIIGLLCLVLFVWKTLNNKSIKVKICVVIMSLCLCVFLWQFVQIQMADSLYFQKRVEDTLQGNSSGRDVLYSNMASYFWNETSPLQFVFGSGAYATVKIFGIYAHNDWLEIAINQGVLGIMIYILYWILFMKECFSRHYTPQVKLALQLLFIIYFMKTLFSMSYNDMTIPATFALGYCLSKKNVKDVSRI